MTPQEQFDFETPEAHASWLFERSAVSAQASCTLAMYQHDVGTPMREWWDMVHVHVCLLLTEQKMHVMRTMP